MGQAGNLGGMMLGHGRSSVGPLLRILVLVVVALGAAPGQEPGKEAQDDLIGVDLADLLKMEVTSVSRKPERLWDAAAAISVITDEDIRRLGALNIAEALRIVPGMNVARINSNQWAISSRGFNEQFADKLKVLQDGRSLYTPLFSGTFWDVQDTFLHDLDRIEIIRGPGATLWGANAVNGVINITTKGARETQGGLVYGTLGTEEHGAGGVRYGFEINEDMHARVYVTAHNRDGLRTGSDRHAKDDWSMVRSGFRLDWDASERDSLVFMGDIYRGSEGFETFLLSPSPPFAPFDDSTMETRGGNLSVRWTRQISESSEASLLIYYDRTERDITILREMRDTFAVDFQHRFRVLEAHDIVWGAVIRLTSDDISGTFGLDFIPDDLSSELFGGFVQDDIELIQNELFLTLGAKIEHDDHIGFEFQPSARIRWLTPDGSTLWAAVSRSVRAPARTDHDAIVRLGVIPDPLGGPPMFPTFIGHPDFVSEELLAFEIGFRTRPLPDLSVDIALFYNDYDNIQTQEPGAPIPVGGPTPYVILPFFAGNASTAEIYGCELSVDWQATERWRLSASWSVMDIEAHAPRSGDPVRSQTIEGESPQHQFNLRSAWDIAPNVQLDGVLYYVDSLRDRAVPAYLRLDARIAWSPTTDLTLALGAQNLLDDRHPEFNTSFASIARESERLVYLTVSLRF